MPKGTVAAAHSYLEQLDLRVFSTGSATGFRRALDGKTDSLARRLPERRWGIARKCLNIFLRDAAYNRFLCRAYNLDRIEPWLEVPLDRQVAEGLKREAGRGFLPRWRAIKTLDPEVSRRYQDFAARVAKGKGIHRVHLDLLYWRPSRR